MDSSVGVDAVNLRINRAKRLNIGSVLFGHFGVVEDACEDGVMGQFFEDLLVRRPFAFVRLDFEVVIEELPLVQEENHQAL